MRADRGGLANTASIDLAPSSPLHTGGLLGARITLQRDRSIFPYVQAHGDWHFAETRLALSSLDPGEIYHLIDIGANAGLFTRQVLNRFDCVATASCFEPSPTLLPILQENLASFPGAVVQPFGLHRQGGTLQLYVDSRNGGNLSFNASAVEGRPHGALTAPVRRISVGLLAEATPPVARGRRLIWKSDTQGLDEVLMAELPLEFWARVDVAFFEAWRIEKPDFDRAGFRAILNSFPYVWTLRRARAVRRPVRKVVTYLSGTDRKWTDFCLTRRPIGDQPGTENWGLS